MIINVRVKPNSKEDSLEKTESGEYLANISEKAEDNKANIGLIKMLSKEFNVSYKNIKIKNPSSRKKIVEIIL
jgi:uncharacterized protein YggU (UPF0235/DUF167 family)